MVGIFCERKAREQVEMGRWDAVVLYDSCAIWMFCASRRCVVPAVENLCLGGSQ